MELEIITDDVHEDRFKRNRVIVDLHCSADYNSNKINTLLKWKMPITVYPLEQAKFLYEPYRLKYYDRIFSNNKYGICSEDRFLITWFRDAAPEYCVRPFRDHTIDERYRYCIEIDPEIRKILYDASLIFSGFKQKNLQHRLTNKRSTLMPLMVSLPYTIEKVTTIYDTWHIFETGGGDGGYIIFEKYEFDDILKSGGCHKVPFSSNILAPLYCSLNKIESYLKHILISYFGDPGYIIFSYLSHLKTNHELY